MTNPLIIQCKKVHPNAIIPTKVNGNLAFDLHIVKDISFSYNKDNKPTYKLMPGDKNLFHTGLQIEMPTGYGCILKDRSGLSSKYGLHILAGVIDNSFRGEWCICIINLGKYSYEFVEGDRIAQGIIIPEYSLDFIEVDKLSETLRGEKGFGNSGK